MSVILKQAGAACGYLGWIYNYLINMDFLAITRRSWCFNPNTIEIIGLICAARVILANPILL
jgi:hypothetical protein